MLTSVSTLVERALQSVIDTYEETSNKQGLENDLRGFLKAVQEDETRLKNTPGTLTSSEKGTIRIIKRDIQKIAKNNGLGKIVIDKKELK